MKTQDKRLSDFLDANRLNRNLIADTFNEFSNLKMQNMAIIDLEKDQAAICDYAINILKVNLSETLAHVTSIGELVDSVAAEVSPGYDRERVIRSCSKATLKRKFKNTNQYTFIARRAAKNNRLSVIMFSFMPLDNEHSLILMNRNEITSTLEYDILTGGRNRIGFFHLMQDILDDCKSVEEYSLVFFNIRTFHHINELYGMNAGDAVLQHFYTTLGYSNLSPIAYSRIESDHFYALVRRHLVTKENLSELRRMETTFNGKKIAYHCLCGIYNLCDLKESPASMCGRASIAANYVKDPFNEPWREFDEEMRKRYISDSEVVERLDSAIARKEFVPYYQPIVNVRTGRIAMAEALARWISPEFGFVSPGYFVPSLEKHGGISRVDNAIANQVFDLLRDRVRNNKHFVPIDVNISWIDFGDPDFVDNLVERIKDAEVTTDMCRYEITESTIAEITESSSKILNIFTDNQAKLLIDDFGKGYSFSTMRDIDFYIIKLDKSLIDNLGTSRKADLLVDTLIGMFHKLGAKVVAEGVETLQQVEYLRNVGCDYIQGFYFYRPMPQEQFIELLDKEAMMDEVVAENAPMQVWVEREVLEAQYAQLKKANEEAKCLKMLLAGQNIHYFEWDIKTHTDTCPDSFVKLYNMESNLVHNIPEVAELCHPEDLDRFRDFYYRAEKGEHIGSDFFRFLKPDGKGYTWYLKNFYTIFDKNGKPYKVIMTMQDCTQRYLFQAFLKRNELLIKQQDIITFSYTAEDDKFEFTYLAPTGNIESVVLRDYLATADNPDATSDQKYLASQLKTMLENKDSQLGYVDFFDQRLNIELRAHYSKVASEYGKIYAIVGQAEDINRTREKLQKTIANQKDLISMTEGLRKIYNGVSTLNLIDGSSRVLLLDTYFTDKLNTDMSWQDIANKYAKNLIKPVYRDLFLKFMETSTLEERMKGNRYISIEYEDCVIGWIRGSIMPSEYDENGRLKSVLFASMPISSEKEAIDRLVYLSETDRLTGIKNRYSGDGLIDKAIKEHKAGVFAIIDCDKFKLVNDTFGHLVGDRYLIKVASCLNENNKNGITMRLGGDEFALYIYGEYDKADINSFFDTLFHQIVNLKIEDLKDFPISVSVGAVIYDGKSNTCFDDLYRGADKLLYESKKTVGCKLTV